MGLNTHWVSASWILLLFYDCMRGKSVYRLSVLEQDILYGGDVVVTARVQWGINNPGLGERGGQVPQL